MPYALYPFLKTTIILSLQNTYTLHLHTGTYLNSHTCILTNSLNDLPYQVRQF